MLPVTTLVQLVECLRLKCAWACLIVIPSSSSSSYGCSRELFFARNTSHHLISTCQSHCWLLSGMHFKLMIKHNNTNRLFITP
eukprot:m.253306 g.253306  ORF g.253306 m.253306 type:complete len:83 (+) comp15483_c1_seq1:6165-6413(+)